MALIYQELDGDPKIQKSLRESALELLSRLDPTIDQTDVTETSFEPLIPWMLW